MTTSARIWEALHVAYGAPTEARICQLNMHLQIFRRNDLPVTVCLRQVNLVVDELAAVGRPSDPGMVNASIYNNLRPDYSEIVVAMSIREGGSISSTELSIFFTGHETRINRTKTVNLSLSLSSSNPAPEVNFTSAPRGNQGIKRGR